MDFVRPQQGERLRLGLRNLYIVPTRFGWLWLAGLLLLQVVGIQLQSNGPLLLSFLMLGLFLLALHLTHFNLQGLELVVDEPQPGFAGTPLVYPLRLHCSSRCEGLQLGFDAAAAAVPRGFDRGDHALAVAWRPRSRGLQQPGCLRLQTTAPLGLFICWARWQPAVPQLVWPAPVAGPVRQLNAVRSRSAPLQDSGGERQEGSEDWRDLAPHRPEDGASRLAWKLLAQGRGRYAKRFADPADEEPLLALDPAVPFERGLEHLSERVCRLHARGLSYGLVLGEQRLPPGRGPAQRERALAALATCR
jgi:uncharacterized protein (DUF58 family)